MSSLRASLPVALAVVLALALGYLAGRIATTFQLQRTPITVVDDNRPAVPVVRIDGTENGAIVGTIDGNTRVLVGDDTIASGDGRFQIPLRSLQAVQTVIVPPGMHFVASKNGTKYYPINSPQGERLTPANRIYFKTAQEAEAAGFRP